MWQNAFKSFEHLLLPIFLNYLTIFNFLKYLPSFELTNSYNFQVLGVKKIAGSACDRFRILISDGLYSNSFAMLATQLNPMVHNK